MAKLRCKAGDIAIYKALGDLNDDKLVSVVARSHAPTDLFFGEPAWQVQSLGSAFIDLVDNHDEPMADQRAVNVPDSCLIPIRDNPGDDESLAWSEKPKRTRTRRKAELL